jgi:predicted lipoprotein with Yx(FWY)xxD motif
MKAVLASLAAAVAVVAIAACGGGGDSGSSSASRMSAGSSALSAKRVGGVGRVLVDSSGKALYTSNQEEGGKVRCIDGCTSFWKPLTTSGGAPQAPTGVANLGVIRRPDGTRQLTEGGEPLYTFVEDSPGNVKGDGFSDDFAGRHFVWHAVLVGSGGGSSSDSGGSSGGPSGSYGY